MKSVKAETLKVGDVILPPKREVRLWMKAELAKRGLSEKALHMTIQNIEDGYADKKGPWLVFTATTSDEWNQGRPGHPWKIKMRPSTNWPKIDCLTGVPA